MSDTTNKPAETPQWLVFAIAAGIVGLLIGSAITVKVLFAVLTCALTAVLAYVAVCFACHTVASLSGALGGLNTVFQSWR